MWRRTIETVRCCREPKTEAARQAREQFERRVEEQTEKEQEIAFSILVWGASPDRDIPIARKRIDIGNQLTQDGHNAMFSEDLTNLVRAWVFQKRAKSLLKRMPLISLLSSLKIRLARWPRSVT